ILCLNSFPTRRSSDLNGKDMKDWTPKIRLHEVGDNYANTFRVEDGLLKVRYDGYDNFNQQYGHLAYNKPFSYYVLRVEYRFVDRSEEHTSELQSRENH